MSYERKPVQTKAAPTAGPSQDDRSGAGNVGVDMKARIIKYDFVDGRMMIDDDHDRERHGPRRACRNDRLHQGQ